MLSKLPLLRHQIWAPESFIVWITLAEGTNSFKTHLALGKEIQEA